MTPTDVAVLAASCTALSLFALAAGLLLSGIDRKLAARMQARVGPPVWQPFLDTLKLLQKESVVPAHAVPWLFNAAPVIALASSILVLFYVPVGSFPPVLGADGDLVLVMYLLTLPALALVAGGFASGSPYATVGAQREMVTMIAYEFPLAVVVIGVAWRLGAAGISHPFALQSIAQTPVWSVTGPLGALGALVLLLVLAAVTPAELSRIPCDTPEAETELAGGLLVEYSGRNLAMFSLSQAVKTLVFSAVAVAIFLPWNISSLLAVPPALAAAADLLFFLGKTFAVSFLAVTLVRVAMARFRINDLVRFYWVYLPVAAFLGLVLLMADVAAAHLLGVIP
ncbi:MAG: NADH-quinone oxidoreductase subunit H [Methanolinea sp.]|nr:NADH-quinone oxidoreductase subunit H [Methanolinea sp.]